MSTVRTPNPIRYRTAFARRSCLRTFAGLMAVVFLMLQLLAPSLASAAKGDWIEICSEYGITLAQVNLSDDNTAEDSKYSDCKDCTFCALAAPMSPPTGLEFELSAAFARQATGWAEPVAVLVQRYQWPESRGPPVRTQNNNAERNSCASLASTLQKGGEPWT